MQMMDHVSEQRKTQVRYIMQVDEEAFRTSITSEQLLVIERKEMGVIIDELVSSVGLQRFRFVERQTKGKKQLQQTVAPWMTLVAYVFSCRRPCSMSEFGKNRCGSVYILFDYDFDFDFGHGTCLDCSRSLGHSPEGSRPSCCRYLWYCLGSTSSLGRSCKWAFASAFACPPRQGHCTACISEWNHPQSDSQ